MSTLLLTFANSATNPLATLTEEYLGIAKALRDRNAKKDFSIIPDQIANRDKFIEDIRTFQNDICLFLFSGHAGGDRVILNDGEAFADGMAELLGQCQNLELVILNGCSTAGHVKALLDKNIPIVIATNAPADDSKASQFSISFFQELANNKSIRVAFNKAAEEANLKHNQKVEITSRGLVTGEESDDSPLWGMYYKPENAGRPDIWRLPMSVPATASEDINEEIKRALRGVNRKYKITPPEFDEVNPVLEKLPFLINEPLRNLFALSAKTQEDNQFYNTPSRERFQMLLYAYRSIINLTTYVLLAELWDESLQGGKQASLPEECQQLLQSTLFAEQTSDQHQSNLSLLLQLAQVLKDKQTPCFFTEVCDLLDELNKDLPKQALAYLESKIADQDLSTDDAILRLCLDTEKNVAIVLYAFRFMVNYSLTSVKDIELLKYRSLKSPSFVHQIIPLQFGYIIPKKGINQQASGAPLDTTSIIFHRHGDGVPTTYLNLSPFLLDKNALIKAPKADLHYLLSYSTKQQVFYFRRVASYEEVWAIRPEKKLVSNEDAYYGDGEEEDDEEEGMPQNFYSLLKDEISSFSEQVLHQTPGEP